MPVPPGKEGEGKQRSHKRLDAPSEKKEKGWQGEVRLSGGPSSSGGWRDGGLRAGRGARSRPVQVGTRLGAAWLLLV